MTGGSGAGGSGAGGSGEGGAFERTVLNLHGSDHLVFPATVAPTRQ